MGKATSQGTAWESTIRKRAESNGRSAQRNAKAGQKHESDVTVTGLTYLPLVVWKNYLKGHGRRKSVRMVVMLEDDFWNLYALDTEHRYGLEIQAKATERLGIQQTLSGLLSWMQR